MAALAIASVLLLPAPAYALLLGAGVLLAGWEWGALLGFDHRARYRYCGMLALLLTAIWLLRGKVVSAWVLLAVSGGFWLLAPLWLIWFAGRPRHPAPRGLLGLAGVAVTCGAWLALLTLRQRFVAGPALVVFLLFMTWVADTAAYFAGRRWGYYRLAPRISPGKTWEGAIGALLAVLVLACIGAGVFGLNWPGFILLCMVTAVFSIIGDLFESMIKRQHGVKDSGQLLPGHGGVLDRIDSLSATAPIFVLGLGLLLHWGGRL